MSDDDEEPFTTLYLTDFGGHKAEKRYWALKEYVGVEIGFGGNFINVFTTEVAQ